MNVKFTREQKKYLTLIEEARELWVEGFLEERYYPDMAEINDSLYNYVLVGLGIWKGAQGEICCQYDIDGLKEVVKLGRKNKEEYAKRLYSE